MTRSRRSAPLAPKTLERNRKHGKTPSKNHSRQTETSVKPNNYS